MSIKLNKTGITLRPSSFLAYQQCRRKWALTHLEGRRQAQPARAVIGTAVHKAAELCWKHAIATGKKDLNISLAKDAAVQEFDNLCKKDALTYAGADTPNTARNLVASGAAIFIRDIASRVAIPTHVEKRYVIPVRNHPIVAEFGGTIDYISSDSIADLKTSKRTVSPQNHVLQQSAYKMVAEHHGHKVVRNEIHCVVFKKNPTGVVLPLEPNVEQVVHAVDNILKTLRAFHDGGDPDILFPGNTGYYLCSPTWCGFHAQCDVVHGGSRQS